MEPDKKILLVEDDPFTRFMMSQIVKTLNVELDFARDGHDGYLQVSKNPDAYGVILMDIYMPGLDGPEATLRIRSMRGDPPRNVPIIAVTSDESYHCSHVVNELGMNGFIPKPVTAGVLNGLIDQYCIGTRE